MNKRKRIASIVSNYQFTLDEDGNRIDSAQTEPLVASPSSTATAYGYNAQDNRLLSAGPLSYTYDNEGQLASAAGTAYTFNYDHHLAGIGNEYAVFL